MPVEWVVLVFDKPGVNRLPHRQEHLENIAPTVNSGVVLSASGMFQDKEKTKFAGSSFHLLAESKEEILEFLKTDPYYKAGIWDLNSVIAYPIGTVCRLPKKLDGVNESYYKI